VFFEWCVKQEYLELNCISKIEVPKIGRRLPKSLSKQQAERLLEVVYNLPYRNKYKRYLNHAIISTFLFSGIRKSELLNLKYTDVDIENGTLFIRSGKGDKDRVISMNPQLVQTLDAYRRERKARHKTCPNFLFHKIQSRHFQ